MSNVDVVVPCYNYGRFLRPCVNSVLTQQGVDVRVLIIDDASTDDTSQIGEGLARSDARVEFRRHPANKGHIASYNEGLLDWASSEYSLMLSADDMVAPGALARATRVMDLHRDVGMTYGMALVIHGDDDVDRGILQDGSPDYRIIPGTELLRRCFEKGNAVETPTAVVRTALQQRIGGYRPELPHSGDMEMWMRFAVHGPVGVIRSVQGYVRKHGGNMSDQYYGQQLRDWREIVQACDQILAQRGSQFPESGLWRRAMLTRIGEESCKVASRAFDQGDLDTCQTCLDFAEEVHPAPWSSSLWWRVATKKRLGRAVWSNVRPLWKRVRARRASVPESSSGLSRIPHVSGWWPETP
jgi:hypothetical protein